MVRRSSKYRAAFRPICTWRFFLCAITRARKSLRAFAYCSSVIKSWWASFCMAAIPVIMLFTVASGLVLGFQLRDRFLGKEIVTQFPVERRITAPDPLQHHGRVFLFLIAVMRKNGAQFGVLAGIDALVIPVNCFQLLHQGNNGAMHVTRFLAQVCLVITFVGHGSSLPGFCFRF